MTITKIPLTLLGTQPAEKDGHRFTYVAANNAIELVSPTDAVFSIPDGGGSSTPNAQGTSFGYQASGYNGSGVPSYVFTTTDKYSYTSDTNATNPGTAIRSTASYQAAGASSSTDGYIHGGRVIPSSAGTTTIEKFDFASESNGGDGGELSVARTTHSGVSGPTHAYSAGAAPVVNSIEKFPFSSDQVGTDVGDLISTMGYFAAGHSSTSHGYISGGYSSSNRDSIEKFPFSSDTNATDVGELAYSAYYVSGTNSSTDGYTLGGSTPAIIDHMQKFPFSSDSSATNIGELASTSTLAGGSTSSTTNGYVHKMATLLKHSFSSDSPAASIGTTPLELNQVSSGIQV